MSESLRLPDEIKREIRKAISLHADDKTYSLEDAVAYISGFVERHYQPLIEADLLSKVSTPKKLKEEIQDIFMDDDCPIVNCDSDTPCKECLFNARVEKLSKLFQRYALSLQEQARKEGYKEGVEKTLNRAEAYFVDTVEPDEVAMHSIDDDEWRVKVRQALQKEG